ncbi:hypothetical protein J3R83DRAFT_4314 [Lanmaoa asiatica]|nr:hypothetical protein J3R83DRAFT_4314 [Lanmaoa asiatica]
MSEYSRMKYGHQGCPILYTPLSLHLPDVVRGLRERQARHTDQILWWPCASHPSRESGPLIPAAKQRAALATGESMPHPELQKELSNALSESITIRSNQTDTSNSALHMKTSGNSSPQHFTNHTPRITRFDFVSSYAILDRIAGYPQLFPSHVDSPIPPISQHKRLPSNDLRASVTGALNAALNTKMSLPSLPVPSSKILLSLKHNLKSHTIPDAVSENDVADANPKFSATPFHIFVYSEGASNSTRPPPVDAYPPKYLCLTSVLVSHSHTSRPITPKQDFQVPGFQVIIHSIPRHGQSKILSSSETSFCHLAPGRNVSSFVLIVFLLSIFPFPASTIEWSRAWAERRLSRSGCRSAEDENAWGAMRLDVITHRSCLDDEELEFLIGASWLEYCQIAHQEGLDILRIPLPEGLTPLSPRSLDADLDRIIERYTLQGTSVSDSADGSRPDIPPSAATTTGVAEIKRDDNPSETFQWDSETVVRRDTLQLVERAIEVVRRRRSVKAIETLEQVQFLVEYVEYLRTCGCVGGDSSNS